MSHLARGAFRMAMFGFAITAPFVSCQLLTHSESRIRRDSAYVLGPVFLLSLAFNAGVGASRFSALRTQIALMNAGLYAAIGILLLRRLERPN